MKAGSSYAGGQWAAGDEPLYYVVSPKDVVIAKPRLSLILSHSLAFEGVILVLCLCYELVGINGFDGVLKLF